VAALTCPGSNVDDFLRKEDYEPLLVIEGRYYLITDLDIVFYRRKEKLAPEQESEIVVPALCQ